MRRACAVILAVCIAGGLSAQSIDPTAATVKLVKTESISSKALKKQVDVYEAAHKAQNQPFTDKERTDVLWLLIDRILFRQAAEREHIRLTQEQTQAAIEQARQMLSMSIGRQATEADLKAVAAQQGISWDQWVDQMKENAIPELYVAQTRAAAVQNVDPPSEGEIRRYYRANVTQFAIGDIIEFKHIFTKTYDRPTKELRDAARRKIDEVALKLRNGESYEDLVVKYSEDDKTAKAGGYVGYIQVDKADIRQYYGAEFVDAVFDLEEGQVSGVLQSARGYHVIKVIRKMPAKLYGLDETTPPDYRVTPRSAIRDAVLMAKRQDALVKEIEKVKLELRAQAKIEIIEKNLGFQLQKSS
jgi:peptidyl-prolyl cis-trans isomerase SurA